MLVVDDEAAHLASIEKIVLREGMRVLTAATREVGSSLVVVTHDQAVADWCERHVQIVDGRVHSDRSVAGVA